MGQPVEVVRVDRAAAGRAVETLARAFRDRPPLSLYYPAGAARQQVAPAFMSLAVYPGIRYGEVQATRASGPDFAGVAVWMPSEAYPVGLWRLLRAAPLGAVVGFGRAGGSRMQRLGLYIDSVHGRLAPVKHVYLQSLGVDPEFQGKGHAGRLLRHMLARLDATGTPCYLDTLDQQNVGVYEHLGFSVVGASRVPGTEATLWAMLRRPGGSDGEPPLVRRTMRKTGWRADSAASSSPGPSGGVACL